MNAHDFARRHFGEFKVHGDEIIPRLCPFCKGGSRGDKDTFALNTRILTYNCKRASCGQAGHFTEICKKFNEVADRDNFEMYRPPKMYRKPEIKLDELTDQIEKYMKLRKISKPTYGPLIKSDGQNIIFPYYDQDGQLTFVKYRPARKIEKGERKMWREKDCKPILWGMDRCESSKPLIITEGEFDALSLIESGIYNAVSVPSGAEDMTWINECWEWLEQFDKIVLFGDSDPPGQEMVRKLIVKLGESRCYTVHNSRKDANELLFYEGPEAVRKAVEDARPVPVVGLIDLADVTPLDLTKVERVRSNIKALDNAIGGFLMGELSVWTGKRGQGKSTFLGQMLAGAVDENKKVCAYSGELRADRFQYWINLQIAGPKNLKTFLDQVKEKEVPYLDKETTAKIKEWYRGKFFLYDNTLTSQNAEEYGILKLFTYAAKRYDCKVFLVDNLMTARFDTTDDSNYYRAQSNFVGELVNFAKTHNVHVHLVAHPRKTKGHLANDDISGTGDITNRADNVFSIDRLEEESVDTILEVLKNRSEGVQGEKIGLRFDKLSKRFHPPSAHNNWQYGWENYGMGQEIEQKEWSY